MRSENVFHRGQFTAENVYSLHLNFIPIYFWVDWHRGAHFCTIDYKVAHEKSFSIDLKELNKIQFKHKNNPEKRFWLTSRTRLEEFLYSDSILLLQHIIWTLSPIVMTAIRSIPNHLHRANSEITCNLWRPIFGGLDRMTCLQIQISTQWLSYANLVFLGAYVSISSILYSQRHA